MSWYEANNVCQWGRLAIIEDKAMLEAILPYTCKKIERQIFEQKHVIKKFGFG